MKQLMSDLTVAGSTTKFIKNIYDTYILNQSVNLTAQQLAPKMTWKAKRNPQVYGRRTAALIGLCFTEFDGQERETMLDIVIGAIDINENYDVG